MSEVMTEKQQLQVAMRTIAVLEDRLAMAKGRISELEAQLAKSREGATKFAIAVQNWLDQE